MKIKIRTISHEKQRYPTVGDYVERQDGTTIISVSDMGNEDYAFLVALHELIEAHLTKKRGIKEEDISEFDEVFESHRIEGNTDEPGDHVDAPYRKEHFFATSIERLVAGELGIEWNEYDNAINNL